MITEDRARDIAKAIEQAHYPTTKNPTGQAFMGEARSFIAALNAAETIANDRTPPPKEFAFADDVLSGGTLTDAAKGVLTFSGQPKEGDGFSIGKNRYEFFSAAVATSSAMDIILVGGNLAATIAAAVAAINGRATAIPGAGDSVVTALQTAPDVITVTAKEPGEPLLPVQTVTWSRMPTAEEKALADRANKAEDPILSSASAAEDPLRIHSGGTMSIGGEPLVGVVSAPLSGGSVAESQPISGGVVSAGSLASGGSATSSGTASS